MGIYLLYAIPMALAWLGITNTITPASFVLGYVFSLLMLLVTRPKTATVRWRRLPGQMWAGLIFMGILFRDILLSSVDVARRVLARDMRLKPGIVAVTTQDPTHNKLIAALSGDVITLTPGELMVDVRDDDTVMYIHTLDVDQTGAEAVAAQKKRLELLQRMLGRGGRDE